MMESFTDPFRYIPHPLVRKAARQVIERLDMMISEGLVPEEVAKGFIDGKMLGVLICQPEGSGVTPVTLAAFSGSVGGRCIIEGFVPPIFDLTEEGGFYRTHEAEISEITSRISVLTESGLVPARARVLQAEKDRESEICRLRALRHNSIEESQFRNAEIKRAKDRWKARLKSLSDEVLDIKDRIDMLKNQRASMSDELQKWIFSRYIVRNAEGNTASILEIFKEKGIMPPGGTGDCAAPKLLNHAFRNGLKPVAMGEFWYGRSPVTAVRTHGHFYPSCTSKCGPLLAYMLRGLPVAQTRSSVSLSKEQSMKEYPEDGPYGITTKADIIYEDREMIVASKPSGMPSVPGLDGRRSLQELLQSSSGIDILPVHRLDMDTSGIIVYAKTASAEVCLKKQFEEHTVRKTYMARLSPADNTSLAGRPPQLKAGDKGMIDIPLSPDYDERPRQKVDLSQGKPSLTEYEVISVNEDGTADIIFHPHTGRTHQLRIHSSHALGLGRPILGDLLYGGCGSVWTEGLQYARLHLHALSITLRHPATGAETTFTTDHASH